MKRRRGDARFKFHHRLTRDAAYDAVLASNRRRLHSAALASLAPLLREGAADELEQLAILQAHAAGAERWREAHQFACSVLSRRTSLGRFQGWEEHAAEARRLWALARDEDAQLPQESSHYLNCLSARACSMGELDRGAEFATRAVEIARACGNLEQLGLGLSNTGMAIHYAGQHRAAMEKYREAWAAFKAAGVPRGQAQVSNNLGLALHEAGLYEEAVPILRAGLELVDAHGFGQMRAILHLNLGLALVETSEEEEAQLHFAESLKAAQATGDLANEGSARGYLGELAERRGDFHTARAGYAAAVALARATQSPRFTAWWLSHLCLLSLREGRLEEARAHCTDAQAHAQRSGGLTLEAFVLLDRAEVELAHHDSNQARQYYDRAAALTAQTATASAWRLGPKLDKLRGLLAAAEPHCTAQPSG